MSKFKINDFSGCVLTKDEKLYREYTFANEECMAQIDKEFIPYLDKINKFDFIMTTQCCTGHNKEDLIPHLDFRTFLLPQDVIEKILVPMNKKFFILMLNLGGCNVIDVVMFYGLKKILCGKNKLNI